MRILGMVCLLGLLTPGLFGEDAQDVLKVSFVNPYTKAQTLAKEKNRLFFVKPVYGGLNKEGAADYRCGTW